MLGNFCMFSVIFWTFFKINFFKKYIQEYHQSAGFFGPILLAEIGSCFQWQKVCFFPISRRKFRIQGTKKFNILCDILTALCHRKLFFFIRNIEMCSLVNQIFDFLFFIIIFYHASFSQFCIKKTWKNSQFWGLGHVPKMGRKTLECQTVLTLPSMHNSTTSSSSDA